jgi:hypothetical protein
MVFNSLATATQSTTVCLDPADGNIRNCFAIRYYSEKNSAALGAGFHETEDADHLRIGDLRRGDYVVTMWSPSSAHAMDSSALFKNISIFQ